MHKIPNLLLLEFLSVNVVTNNLIALQRLIRKVEFSPTLLLPAESIRKIS